MLKNKWNIGSKIAFGYSILLLCMGISTFVLMSRVSALKQEIGIITNHDLQVHNLSNQIEKYILDMETGQHGYIITGDTQYLQPYNTGKANWLQEYNRLHELLADDPAQQSNLEALRSNIDKWMETSGSQLIPLRRDNKSAEIQQYFAADPGKKYMDEMRSQWDYFRGVEKQLTSDRVTALDKNNNNLQNQLYIITLAALAFSIAAGVMISRSITGTIRKVTTTIRRVASAEQALDTRIEVRSNDEISELAEATNALLETLRQQDWLKTSIADMVTENQGMSDMKQLARSFIGKMAHALGATYGVFYLRSGQGGLQRLTHIAAFAADGVEASAGKREFRLGEGIVGQAASENRMFLLQDVPDSYIRIFSGLGEAAPKHIIVTPIAFKAEVEAVVELASFEPFTDVQRELMAQISATFGVTINSVLRTMDIERLLDEAQSTTEELQMQSEELQAQSEELLSQQEELKASNDSLRKSEEKLQRQQEGLEEANSELSKRSQQLEAQVRFTEEVNLEIEKQRKALQKQTEELTAMSRYKSEFLANMSHELRTPLNSMLILSQLLGENKDGNLSGKQVEFANTIHGAGGDLLRLINEVLDLSKLEAGKLQVQIDAAVIKDIGKQLQRNFQPVAAKKGLQFSLQVDEDVPRILYTDAHRLVQIVRNFLSNAFKFTEKGSVELRIYTTSYDFSRSAEGDQPAVAIAVADTGLGIPEDKSEMIFEAFQQVDGTTSRQHGGTGLGLTISRELAGLLGGSIEVESREGQGSTFTMYLPVRQTRNESPLLLGQQEAAAATAGFNAAGELKSDYVPHISNIVLPALELNDPQLLAAGEVADDRDTIEPGDKVILIIEDDVPFARFILSMAQSLGFKGMVATQGDKGLALANAYKPDVIMLDIYLPVLDGWTVLDLIKQNPETRHIPVQMLSSADESQQSLMSGAAAYLKKPVSREELEQAFARMETILNRPTKRLLIAETNVSLRNNLAELIEHDDVAITAVGNATDALKALQEEQFDCMVMDLEFEDMTGFELLDRIRNTEQLRTLPIIIFTEKDLDLQQERKLRKFAESIIIKNVKSQERLYAETVLYLHRVEAELPEARRQMLNNLHNAEAVFEGKHILLVEDDIRNVFALTNVLEEHKLKVTYAENGREALNVLKVQTDIDLVLMDIMMPEMDGYEAMRQIRSNPLLERLPIIALTAKAMKQDRQKCIDAGASDYISKPINTDKLLSLLKVWLHK